ncbi:ABC transporter substrate-binding protein [Bradyrhizobium tropiciagri]|uniref:ABC transporter substrate-binding protein n=1 Tax=Bradyrhizobium tropiciagri TaxID=312253 RepID=UPI001BA71256|nr:ABC transporter substrate-binding protein [Bradyrhizobium tropiciagri]MBR0896750.1 ABC transporter substrate-binding protein [Bradyrhizobium tropiciagri]
MGVQDCEKASRALRPELSRREVIKIAGSAGVALLGSSVAFAAPERRLRVGFISPRTGPLGEFGATDGYVLDLIRRSLADGFRIGEATYQIDILDRDTQSDPSRASQLAKGLIGTDKVDLMLATAAPETINPVADACEAAGVPCVSTVMPWEAWYFGRGAKPGAPSPFRWSYHFGFGVDEIYKMYMSLWGDEVLKTNMKVGVLYPNDADGNAVRTMLAPRLSKQGFKIVDPGPYEDGTTDYSAQISLFKKEQCEIFNTFPIPPDFAAFWRQAAQQGYTKTVKICQVAKTGLFPSGVEALGGLGINLSTASYWHKAFPYKSPLVRVSGAELADGYEKATGKQWTQQLGGTLSVFDAGFEALRAAKDPANKADVAKSISTLQTTTVAGKVDFNSGPVPNVSAGPLVGSQWIKATAGSKYKLDLVVTENATDPNVPIGGKLLPFNGK